MTDDPLIGRDIEGRYKIVEKLGAGGMGVVYRAHHALLNVDVALKVIHPRFGETPEARERFLREARAATALTHQNIVAVRDVGEFDGKLYLTMDLVKGRTLQEVLEREGRMSASRAVGIIAQVLGALEAAHAKGIVHRDLKPGNIMVEQGDGIKVLDFGLAKWIGDAGKKDQQSSLTGSGTTVGTLMYMSPEQVAGDPVDRRSDLYSVSVMFYQLLSGSPPHMADSNQHLLRKILLEPPRPLSEIGVHVPALEGLILRGLAKEAKDRPANAAEYLRTMEGTGGLTATAVRATPTMERPAAAREVVVAAKPARRAPWAAIAAALVLLGGGGFFGWRYMQSQKYERHIREGRAAIDDKRWADAATAFESAQKIEDSAEAVSGLKRAKFESNKDAAKKARTLDEEVKAWEEASKYGDVSEELDAVHARRDLIAVAAALDIGDIETAERTFKQVEVGALEVDKRTELQELSQRLVKLKEGEGAAAKVVDEVVKAGEVFAERSAWQDYVKAFAKGPRGAEGQKRLREIEKQISKGPGLLIDVEPRGANVYLNGTKVGVSPLLLRDLAAGPYLVLLTAESYDPVEKQVEMRAGNHLSIKEKLPPLAGDVRVSTSAPGAEVYLDGKQELHSKADAEGRAAFERVLIGSCTVRAEAKGFDSAKQTIDVKAKQVTEVALSLVEHPGTLIVKTNPAGLDVVIGDQEPRKSPVRAEKFPAGPVTVKVRDAGGYEREISVRVRGDEESVVDVDVSALEAVEKRPYAALVEIARTRDPKEIFAACEAFLKENPNARASSEVERVRQAMEILTGKVTIPPFHDAELPPLLRDFKSVEWSPELSRSGHRLVLCKKGADGKEQPDSMQVFDLAAGRLTGPFPNAHEDYSFFETAFWSNTGRYVNAVRGGFMEIHDTTTGRQLSKISLASTDLDWDYPGWLWTEGDRYLLFSSPLDGNEVRAFDPATGKQLWSRKGVCILGDFGDPTGCTTQRFAAVWGGGNGLLALSDGAIPDCAVDPWEFWTIGHHIASRRVACCMKKKDAEVVTVNIWSYEDGARLKAFDIPFNLTRIYFSCDGTRLWGEEEGRTSKDQALVGFSIEKPSDIVRIGLDPSRRNAGGNLFGMEYILVASRSTASAEDRFDKLEVYHTGTGKRVTEIGGPWKGSLVGQTSDEHMIYLREDYRHVVIDARKGRAIFDRKDESILSVEPICRTGMCLVSFSGGAGPQLFADNNKPVRPGVEGWVDKHKGLIVTSERKDPNCICAKGTSPAAANLRVLDALTMKPILVDLAFLAALGGGGVHRHGPLWVQERVEGRIRVWRETDVLQALMPNGADPNVMPGDLSAAVDQILRAKLKEE